MALYKNVLISILIVVMASCSSAANLEEPLSIPTPDIGFEVQSEKYLEVTSPNGWNSFKTNKPISLMIQNISEKQITSSQDFGARIFLLKDDKWVELQNKVVYTDDPVTLEPDENSDLTNIATVFILPDLPDYSVTSNLRIFVIGNLTENGKESKKVASYIDMQLKS